jgi:hypothetical protein
MRELVFYLGAAAAYIGLGVAVPELLFSWPVGVAFLLICVLLRSALSRRLS